MIPNHELRVTKLIRERTEGPGKISLHKLMTEINKANEKADTHCTIKFPTLKKLKMADPKLGLTQEMLVALATYFPELKLQPPFVIPGVFEALVGTPRLVFMLGAKPRPAERRNDISHWDALSLTELFARCSRLHSPQDCVIDYVFWRSPVKKETLGAEPWSRVLDDDEASVVSIGSPMASLSSEIMLARMFNVPPFTPPFFSTKDQVPFCFVWRPQFAGVFQSAFGLGVKSLEALDAKMATEVKRNRASAFVLEGNIHKVPVKGRTWTMYGVIAAQRRAAGNVWLVVSGLAGSATCAAANKVKDIVDELPWAKGQPSKVLWVPVKVEISAGKSSPGDGDIRKIVSADFDGPARIWPS